MQFTATSDAVAEPERGPLSRRGRVHAGLADLGLYVLIQITFGTITLAVFLVQSGGGARDLTSSTATVGWAIALAAIPAWLGALGHATVTESATPGQRRAGTTVEGSPVRRLVRLAIHPLSALGWWWVTVVAILATLPGVPFLLAAMTMSVATGGGISALLILRDPDARSLHDRIAGTRLVAR